MSTSTKANDFSALGEIDVTTKARVLLEALPYIQRFQGSIFVVKYGGSFMDDPDPAFRRRVVTDIVFLAAVGIHVVVVHGGGKAISRAMDQAGLKTEFIQGLRVTSPEAVAIVDEVLNGTVSRDITDMLAACGGLPCGIPGNDVLRCEKRLESVNGQTLDLGRVGRITHVEAAPIRRALEAGQTPVLSPLARDADGALYNTNADEAAGQVAVALGARRLVYLSDVPGLLRDPRDPDTLISTLALDEVEPLKTQGVIAKGMLPKVDSGVHALRHGVHRVHLVDGRLPHSILLEIFTDRGIGTEIVRATL